MRKKNPFTIVVLLTALYAAAGMNGHGQPGGVQPKLAAHKDPAFTGLFRRTSGVVASDGGFSVPLSDGRVLWLFGDSHLNDFDVRTGTIPCLFQMRNAAMLQDTNDWQHPRTLAGAGPGFKSFFKNGTNENLWFWPVAGFQSGRVVYVYLSALRKRGGGGGAFDFQSVGQDSLAKLKFPEMEIAEYLPLLSFAGIDFGCGFVMADGGKFVYAFGSKRDKTSLELYVARFKIADPDHYWTFWDGNHWDPNVARATVLSKDVATSMSVCRVKNKFVSLTSQFSIACDQGREIYSATGSHPTGPFSRRRTLFELDDALDGHYPFFYLPVGHPEFLDEKNELLVTYCINGYAPCIPTCVNGRSNPDHYRPKAIRVPLKLIDSEW